MAIGDSYQGGKVAYILQSSETIYATNGSVLYSYDANVQHGLIAATTDQSIYTIWALTTYEASSVPAPGATGTAIGTGLTNTTAIIAQNGAGTTYAAGLCDAYINKDTGTGVYSDWYLPSKDELNQLYLNQGLIGGFASAYYWSSSESESDSLKAWERHFGNGSQYDVFKYNTVYVRAVRAF